MNACMDGCIDRCKGWMYRWMDGLAHERTQRPRETKRSDAKIRCTDLSRKINQRRRQTVQGSFTRESLQRLGIHQSFQTLETDHARRIKALLCKEVHERFEGVEFIEVHFSVQVGGQIVEIVNLVTEIIVLEVSPSVASAVAPTVSSVAATAAAATAVRYACTVSMHERCVRCVCVWGGTEKKARATELQMKVAGWHRQC